MRGSNPYSGRSHYLDNELSEILRTDDITRHHLMMKCADGFWLWDMEKPETMWAGPKFWAVLGEDADAHTSHKYDDWRAFVHQDDLAAYDLAIEDGIEDADFSLSMVLRHKHRDGSTIWIRRRGVMLRDEAGRPLRMFGMHHDITETVKQGSYLAGGESRFDSLEDLSASQSALLQLVLDNVPSRIWVKDDKNHILFANLEAAQSMDTTPAELIGADTYDLFPDMAEKYHQDDLAVINSGSARRNIIEAYTPRDGDAGWVSTDKIPFTGAGSQRSLLVIARDITAQRAREVALETKSNSQEEFASLVTHDLQAPIQQATTFAALLDRQLTDDGVTLSQHARTHLDGLVAATNRMRHMVTSLYEMSLIETATLNRSLTEFSDIVSQAIDLSRADIEAADATLTLGQFPQLDVDAALATQAFHKLISNACKYAGSDSVVIDISYEVIPDKGLHVFAITDNGIGIPHAHQQEIFEPFRRLYHASDRVGAGLGLAAARRAFQAHGGTLELDSDYKDGARFLIKLPI